MVSPRYGRKVGTDSPECWLPGWTWLPVVFFAGVIFAGL